MMISKMCTTATSLPSATLMRHVPACLSLLSSTQQQTQLWRQSMRTFSSSMRTPHLTYPRTLSKSGAQSNRLAPRLYTALRQFSSTGLEGTPSMEEHLYSPHQLSESYGSDDMAAGTEMLTMCEPRMCVRAITEVVARAQSEAESLNAKILDFGAGSGQVGQLLAEAGFTDIYGQEGT